MDKWNEHIGSIWFNMLSQVPLNKEGIAIEIAPGNVSKIGRGLAQYGFKGTLYIIEPNYFSLGEIIGQYQELLPSVNLMPVNRTLRAAVNLLPKNPDIVLSNHPLDDMIIGDILTTPEFDKFFTNHYDKCSIEETKLLWEIFKERPESLKQSLQNILSDWLFLIRKLNPKNIAISQYFSFFFKSHGLVEPDRYAIELLRMIEKYSHKEGFNVSYPIDSLVSDRNLWSLIRRIK
jgi:hypothetical protein